MVADSGANRHFIPEHRKDQFMFRTEPIDEPIGGMCSTSQTTATSFGIFAASFKDSKKVMCPFTSVAVAVKNGRKALFSEVQCCLAGNTVIHRGHPSTGTHGIYLKGSTSFIPYEYSEPELAWYVRVKAPNKQHATHARAQSPRQMLRS